MKTGWLLSVVLAAASGSVCAQATWIVDAGGGAHFTSIAAAFDAAAPGDTLRVRPGVYAGFARAPAKGVCIVGDGPGVVLDSPLSLANVPGGQTLHLEGLRVDARINPWGTPGVAGTRALVLSNCDCLVLARLELFSAPGSVVSSYGREAIYLANCSGVLAEVAAKGGDGANALATGFSGGEAVEIDNCRLALSRCTLRNGTPGTGLLGSTPSNPCAIVVNQSLLAIDECTLVPTTGQALWVANSRVLLADHVGGTGGDVHLEPFGSGGSLEIEGTVPIAPGSAAVVARPQPGLVGPATAARGDTIAWTLHGAPASAGVLVVSLGTQPLALPWLSDTWLFTAAHASAVGAGGVVVGPGGTAAIPWTVPGDPGLAGLTVFVQAIGWLGQSSWKASGVAVTRIL
jgi:hypothetical protein